MPTLIDKFPVAYTARDLSTYDLYLCKEDKSTDGRMSVATLFNGSLPGTWASVTGTAISVAATAPAQTSASQAGVGITITASNAVDGSSSHGAANGGGITINLGSGVNGGNGGTIRFVPGAKDGAGTAGVFVIQQPGGTPGTNELQIWDDGNNFYLYNAVGANTAKAVGFDQFGNVIISSYGHLILNEVQLYQTATNVAAVYNSNATAGGWIQNSAGEATLNTAFTDATGTLAATNISFNVIAGRSYRIDGYLIVSNSTPADGFQMNFNGGSATRRLIDVSTTVEAGGSVVAGTQTSTSLAGVINYTTVTGIVRIHVKGTFKCNTGGTLILQAATNTNVSGTMTLAAGSYIDLQDTVQV